MQIRFPDTFLFLIGEELEHSNHSANKLVQFDKMNQFSLPSQSVFAIKIKKGRLFRRSNNGPGKGRKLAHSNATRRTGREEEAEKKKKNEERRKFETRKDRIGLNESVQGHHHEQENKKIDGLRSEPLMRKLYQTVTPDRKKQAAEEWRIWSSKKNKSKKNR